ncbi:MAG: heavy-metal-associated domain-containing protein [Pirellulales bacterium]
MLYRAFCVLVAFGMCVGCSKVDAPSPGGTAVAFNVAGAPTVEFNVPDMMCPEGCGAKTKEILSEQPGAKEVVINFDAKTATVAVEKDKFDANAAIAALVDYGFENSTLKASTSESDQAAPADQPADQPAN